MKFITVTGHDNEAKMYIEVDSIVIVSRPSGMAFTEIMLRLYAPKQAEVSVSPIALRVRETPEEIFAQIQT
jgi:hypothetical protein